MSKNPEGAILQRDKETYAIVPRTPAGLLTPDVLEKIAGAARKFEIPVIKITSGQRMALVGIKPDDVEAVWEELGMDIGRATELCLHYVQACPGTAVCKFGVQDSLGLGTGLEADFLGSGMPAKLKIGVSGCPLCCAESFVRDVGIIGKKGGWTLLFGGHSGSRPRIADVLAEDLTTEEVTALTKKLVAYYTENAKKKERAARFAERMGVDAIKAAIL